MNETPLVLGDIGGRRSIEQSSDRMVQKAIAQGWPIPDQYRKALIDRQVRIGIDPKANNREATSAFCAVLAADRINLLREQGPAKDESKHVHFHAGATTSGGAGVVTDERIRRAMAAIAIASDASDDSGRDGSGELA